MTPEEVEGCVQRIKYILNWMHRSTFPQAEFDNYLDMIDREVKLLREAREELRKSVS